MRENMEKMDMEQELFVQTVLGRTAVEELGSCQCHEHLMLARGKSYEINKNLLIDDVDKSSEEVMRYKAAGGGTVVDAQPVGCGRVSEGLREISRRTGIHLIGSTGFHKLVFYPADHWIFRKEEDWFTHLFVRECTEGMFADGDQKEPEKITDSKAGMIKTALDVCGPVGVYEKLFRAAAQAQRETGMPMMIHVEQGADVVFLLDFLYKLGVSAEHLIFCHMDRACKELEIHREIAKAGCYLEYDTIGRLKYHSDEEEGSIISNMLEAGQVHKILLSLDTTRARLRSYTPDGIGLDYILCVFLKKLCSMGIGEKELDMIMRRNPKGALAVRKGEEL